MSCQFFEGATTSRGYGNVRVSGKNYSAHRIAFALHYGKDTVGKVCWAIGDVRRFSCSGM